MSYSYKVFFAKIKLLDGITECCIVLLLSVLNSLPVNVTECCIIHLICQFYSFSFCNVLDNFCTMEQLTGGPCSTATQACLDLLECCRLLTWLKIGDIVKEDNRVHAHHGLYYREILLRTSMCPQVIRGEITFGVQLLEPRHIFANCSYSK